MNLAAGKIKSFLQKDLKTTGFFFTIFYSVGVLGIIIPLTRDLFIQLTPFALILSFAGIAVFHQPKLNKKSILIFTSVYIITWAIEAAGVKTGMIFGKYSYGEGLGIKVLETPLLIGLNWVLLIYTTSVITGSWNVPDVIKILISSLMMVLYDIIMEQVAPALDMWYFVEGIVPVRNYFAWFIMAFLLHTLLKITGIKIINRLALCIFIIQSMFFIILVIFFKLAE